MTEHEGLVGIDRAATFLDVKRSWLYEAVRLGKVPSYRVGKFRRFRLSELEVWLGERKDGSNGDGPPAASAGGRG